MRQYLAPQCPRSADETEPEQQNSPNTTSVYCTVSVMISVGLSSVCVPARRQQRQAVPKSPGTTMAFSPVKLVPKRGCNT